MVYPTRFLPHLWRLCIRPTSSNTDTTFSVPCPCFLEIHINMWRCHYLKCAQAKINVLDVLLRWYFTFLLKHSTLVRKNITKKGWHEKWILKSGMKLLHKKKIYKGTAIAEARVLQAIAEKLWKHVPQTRDSSSD